MADDNNSEVTELLEMSRNDSHNHSSPMMYGRDENLAKIEIAVQGVILYLAIFGNATVLIVFKLKLKRLSRMQMFIVHLCIADIFVAFFNVLPQMMWDITYRFQGNDFLCKMVKYFQLVAMYASSYVLVVTALDRYISICHPLTSHTWTRRRGNLMIICAWFLSLLFSVPQLIVFQHGEIVPGSGIYDCWENMSTGAPWEIPLYVTWTFLSIYLIPLVILACVYTRICIVVFVSVSSKEQVRVSFKKKTISEKKLNSTNNPRGHTRSASKSKKKTIHLTLAVVLCYLICWAPFFICQMWSAYDIEAPVTYKIYVVILLLASLNSCTNPWIYLAFSGTMCGQKSKNAKSVRSSSGGTNQVYIDFESCSRSHSLRGLKNTELSKPMLPSAICLSDK